MKRALCLPILLFALTSRAPAGLYIYVNGAPPTPKIYVSPGDHVQLSIVGDGATDPPFAAWLVLTGPGDIDGHTMVYQGSLSYYCDGSGSCPPGHEYPQVWDPGWRGFMESLFPGFTALSVMQFDHAATPPPLHGPLVTDIDFQCKGPGDVELFLLDELEFRAYDIVVIHQAPPPPPPAEAYFTGFYRGVPYPKPEWTIHPNHPSTDDVVTLSGFTYPYYNDCYFSKATLGAPPNLTVDTENRTIELSFLKDDSAACSDELDPLFGFIGGEFGPLPPGHWRFFSNDPYTPFSLEFNVSCIKVLDPNGGESLIAGTTHKITWADLRSPAERPEEYRLQFSIDNGQNWLISQPLIDANCISNTCSYDWPVPAVNSEQCLVAIADPNDPNADDTSDAPFTMYQCKLKADVTGDCTVNFQDLAAITEEWLKCGNPFDLDCLQ